MSALDHRCAALARRASRTCLTENLVAVATGVVLASVACDPCTGVVGCTVNPTIAASGRVVEFVSGRGVADVRVEFIPTDSSVGLADRLTATTDADGLFRVSGTARESAGTVSGDVRLTPPDAADVPFVVGRVSLPVERQRGAGAVLPTWFTHPYLYALGSIRIGPGGPAAAGITVTFTSTGGAPLAGGGFSVVTNSGGQFLVQSPGRGADSAAGTFTFTGAGLPRTYVVPNAYVTPLLADVLPPPVTVYYELGASLAGSVRLLTSSGAPVVGATVSFQRTSGMTLFIDLVNAFAPTNVNGDTDLPLRPAVDSSGTVTGDLTVHLPNSATQIIRNVTYHTIDVSNVRRLGTYTIPNS